MAMLWRQEDSSIGKQRFVQRWQLLDSGEGFSGLSSIGLSEERSSEKDLVIID